MITNILAAVTITIITNVVATDNAKWERDPFIMWPEGGGPMRQASDPTERYLTTNVVEQATVELEISGVPKKFHSDRIISSVTAIMKRLDEWKHSGVRTNETRGHTLTNSVIILPAR